MCFQYWCGYMAGWWQQTRKRLNPQYMAGYVAGTWERIKRK